MTIPHARIAAAACAGALIALGFQGAAGQEQPLGGAARTLVSDRGMPAIDRGLRSQDVVRDPGRVPRVPLPADAADRTAVSGGYLPGTVIVKFKAGADRTAAVSSTMAQISGTSAERPSFADFEIVTIADGADPADVAAELRVRSDVQYAQPRYLNHTMYRPNDPLYANQWNFPALDMERAWDIQPGATSNVIVAVLDTGVAFKNATFRYRSSFAFRLDAGRPDLSRRSASSTCRSRLRRSWRRSLRAPRDFIWNDNDPVDLDGHGTHVSGTVGQLTNNGVGVAGMAFNVRIMPVKVIAETWDLIFDSPERRHRRRGGTRSPLRGRQRRAGDQHEPGPRGRRPGPGRRRRHPLRRAARRVRGHRFGQHARAGQPAQRDRQHRPVAAPVR